MKPKNNRTDPKELMPSTPAFKPMPVEERKRINSDL